MHVRYSYLPQQFADIGDLLADIQRLAQSGDFTLGVAVERFEKRFAEMIGVRHAVGVGSGTDALKLPLAAMGIGVGDEVITAANTFVATVGAIHEVGARAVFVDCDDTFCMDVGQVEAAITPRTKALMPVHYTGYMTEMGPLVALGRRYNLPIVEDACQAILADIDGRRAGAWGCAGAFSLHPLKNLNVWGDGGIVATSDDGLAEKLRLIRNHGMRNRDEIACLGYNSRLDTLHAVVGNWLIGDAEGITARRIRNAEAYDLGFSEIGGIRLPPRPPARRRVYHLYIVFAERRDELVAYCVERGIEAKIHYPIPLYRQEGLAFLGYQGGDFPVADRHAQEIITFPCDQHLTREQVDYVIATVREFYAA
ncbi:MAG: DegT/DnrJ/EryC1/StrS family aminotransferase [Nannocystaceae bacterium]